MRKGHNGSDRCWSKAVSSHMYRDLIPKLADQFHFVASDYPGPGDSDYPSGAQFKPTFANLADVMANFVTTVVPKRFVV